jgi:hypothetical protein
MSSFLQSSSNHQFREASAHSYLGDSFLGIKEEPEIEYGDVIEIPLLCLDSLVVFIDETIPIRSRNQSLIHFLMPIIGENASRTVKGRNLLGILSFLTSEHGRRVSVPRIGTCVVIRELRLAGAEVMLKAKGRYRFKILSVRRRIIDENFSGDRENTLYLAKVLILSESSPISSQDIFDSYYSNKFRSRWNHHSPWVYSLHCPYAISKLVIHKYKEIYPEKVIFF